MLELRIGNNTTTKKRMYLAAILIETIKNTVLTCISVRYFRYVIVIRRAHSILLVINGKLTNKTQFVIYIYIPVLSRQSVSMSRRKNDYVK